MNVFYTYLKIFSLLQRKIKWILFQAKIIINVVFHDFVVKQIRKP